MSEITIKNTKDVKTIKDTVAHLQKKGKNVKVVKLNDNFVIQTSVDVSTLLDHLEPYNETISITAKDFVTKETSKTIQSITETFLDGLIQLKPETRALLLATLPKKWSVYPPMVLFRSGTFDSEVWQTMAKEEDLTTYFDSLKSLFPADVSHFAVNKPIIEEDIMRRPFNLIPIHGDFGPKPTAQMYNSPTQTDLESGFWCHTIQNKIYQTWAPCYTMFSRGNIREKKRLLDSYKGLKGTKVVDLYAGIGYFTLSYLANGAVLFCWEINRWSIEGLIRGLKRNKHKYRLILEDEIVSASEIAQDVDDGVMAFVFFESNEHAIKRLEDLQNMMISHINLGLLPTLKPSWPIAKKLANQSSKSTMIHVHENVHYDLFETLTGEVSEYFGGTSTIEKVKTFAPDVWHVVIDVKTD